jgi:hypothetical protein
MREELIRILSSTLCMIDASAMCQRIIVLESSESRTSSAFGRLDGHFWTIEIRAANSKNLSARSCWDLSSRRPPDHHIACISTPRWASKTHLSILLIPARAELWTQIRRYNQGKALDHGMTRRKTIAGGKFSSTFPGLAATLSSSMMDKMFLNANPDYNAEFKPLSAPPLLHSSPVVNEDLMNRTISTDVLMSPESSDSQPPESSPPTKASRKSMLSSSLPAHSSTTLSLAMRRIRRYSLRRNGRSRST